MPRKLGKLEEEILDSLKGNITRTELEIRNCVNRVSPIYATLNRLIKKGLITRKKRNYIYHYRSDKPK